MGRMTTCTIPSCNKRTRSKSRSRWTIFANNSRKSFVIPKSLSLIEVLEPSGLNDHETAAKLNKEKVIQRRRATMNRSQALRIRKALT